MDDLKDVREVLQRNPGLRWGFVIYRCTYDDDEKWVRFMNHLNTRVRLNLDEDGSGFLFDRIDWAVQEDRLTLENAGPSRVRRKFAQWVEDNRQSDDWLGTPRFQFCAMVVQSDVDSVLDGPPAEEFDYDGDGVLTIVSLDEDEGDQDVGLSYLVPRIYTLLEGAGWSNIVIDGVALP
ncbi:hypothetical protein B5807_11748 [Epicoccum nigrum]|uniref:Uncharacterized protein n=1 Tax=Epicoccum nigrum TaxID=105696 RepID=A0A1Y2LK50_EPING|nr:hypothetical protein B5807_11748 [Epicoccum nigrum]